MKDGDLYLIQLQKAADDLHKATEVLKIHFTRHYTLDDMLPQTRYPNMN